MKDQNKGDFCHRIVNKKRQSPLTGEIELTYRCNLNCIHCYCKGSEDKDRELNTKDWKNILDVMQKEGCIWLVFTGGDPLIRDDFLELYAYAKTKGFIISILTNGWAFTDESIDYLVKFPPYSIEITLNGITQDTYEAITQVEGSHFKVMQNIKVLAKRKLSLRLKTNCLKQNRHEIGRIKKFSAELLGKPLNNKRYFRYDPMIYPMLNRDKAPTDFRLSCEEILELRKQDVVICPEYQEGAHIDFSDLRNRKFLYRCNSWKEHFFINPYGRLKFCRFFNKFSVDLKTTAFEEGFYNVFPQLLKERFKTDSKCKDCSLRPICYHCPARAYLETEDEEAPVPYYCQLAEATVKHTGVKLLNY